MTMKTAAPLPGVPVFVKDKHGKTVTLNNVVLSDSVRAFRDQLAAKNGAPAAITRLIFEGKQLEDHEPLTKYGIRRDSTVHGVFCLKGGAPEGIGEEDFVYMVFQAIKHGDVVDAPWLAHLWSNLSAMHKRECARKGFQDEWRQLTERVFTKYAPYENVKDPMLRFSELCKLDVSERFDATIERRRVAYETDATQVINADFEARRAMVLNSLPTFSLPDAASVTAQLEAIDAERVERLGKMRDDWRYHRLQFVAKRESLIAHINDGGCMCDGDKQTLDDIVREAMAPLDWGPKRNLKALKGFKILFMKVYAWFDYGDALKAMVAQLSIEAQGDQAKVLDMVIELMLELNHQGDMDELGGSEEQPTIDALTLAFKQSAQGGIERCAQRLNLAKLLLRLLDKRAEGVLAIEREIGGSMLRYDVYQKLAHLQKGTDVEQARYNNLLYGLGFSQSCEDLFEYLPTMPTLYRMLKGTDEERTAALEVLTKLADASLLKMRPMIIRTPSPADNVLNIRLIAAPTTKDEAAIYINVATRGSLHDKRAVCHILEGIFSKEPALTQSKDDKNKIFCGLKYILNARGPEMLGSIPYNSDARPAAERVMKLLLKRLKAFYRQTGFQRALAVYNSRHIREGGIDASCWITNLTESIWRVRWALDKVPAPMPVRSWGREELALAKLYLQGPSEFEKEWDDKEARWEDDWGPYNKE